LSQQYLFGEMEAAVIRELVRLDTADEPAGVSDSTQRVGGRRAIYRIWPDFEFEAHHEIHQHGRLTPREMPLVP
jgi:hypothetical protein